MKLSFKCKSPCGNCPYRKDAPLQHWDISEFKDLLANQNDWMGKVYGCHKNNGAVCVGWLLMQKKNRFPSIALRLKLTTDNIDITYLDKLRSSKPLYKSTKEMIAANFPELLNDNSEHKEFDRTKLIDRLFQ